MHDLSKPVGEGYYTHDYHAAPIAFFAQPHVQAFRKAGGNLILLVPAIEVNYPLSADEKKFLAAHGVKLLMVTPFWMKVPLSASVISALRKSRNSGREEWEFFRLHIWNLTQYDTVLYLDIDHLVLGDVRPIFKCLESGFDFLSVSGHAAAMSGGLYGLRPDERIFGAMVEMLHLSSFDIESGHNRQYYGYSESFGTAGSLVAAAGLEARHGDVLGLRCPAWQGSRRASFA